MKSITFILKKDLPTIRAGRIIKLSDDGKFGSPTLMSVEHDCVDYRFPIDVLKKEKDWFELFEQHTDDHVFIPIYKN